MLPKGPLGRQMLKKLKIHPGPTHPHTAQQPQPLQPAYARKARTALYFRGTPRTPGKI